MHLSGIIFVYLGKSRSAHNNLKKKNSSVKYLTKKRKRNYKCVLCKFSTAYNSKIINHLYYHAGNFSLSFQTILSILFCFVNINKTF